jgi:aryl-alcohol dehydrogenase-like predicted oxidoreductase
MYQSPSCQAHARTVIEAKSRSQFGLGCVNLGSQGRAGVRLVHQALDLGVHFFDTADAYGSGQSERVLGRALRLRRQEAFIATKAGYIFKDRSTLASAARNVASPGLQVARRWARSVRGGPSSRGNAYGEQDFSPLYLRKALEGSLRRLGTDFVDLYQLHGPQTVDDDVVALMLDLRSEGKIRGLGVGLERLDNAEDWLSTGALSGIQIPFGLLDPEAGDEIIPRAATLGIPVVVRGVFAGGFVARPSGGDTMRLRLGQPERLAALSALAAASGADTMQLAAWFVTARPGVSTVLVGTSSPRHLSHGVRCVQTPPPEHVLRRLEALVARDSAGRAQST